MTNADIIMGAAQELAKAGVIAYTGETIEVIDADGKKATIQATEAIHTYQHWLHLGYQVQKGEKAVAKITIWKHVDSKEKEDGTKEPAKMFPKTAAFFSASQVKKIEEA